MFFAALTSIILVACFALVVLTFTMKNGKYLTIAIVLAVGSLLIVDTTIGYEKVKTVMTAASIGVCLVGWFFRTGILLRRLLG